MILLSLDPSTTAVGWCLSEDGEYLESGVFLPQGSDWIDRVREVERWLYDLDWDFDAVAFEVASGDHDNKRVDRLLGAVEYVVRVFARLQLDDALVEVNVSEVKASGCHKGALPVANAIIRERYRNRILARGNEGDEADAIGVGLAVWRKAKVKEWREKAG